MATLNFFFFFLQRNVRLPSRTCQAPLCFRVFEAALFSGLSWECPLLRVALSDPSGKQLSAICPPISSGHCHMRICWFTCLSDSVIECKLYKGREQASLPYSWASFHDSTWPWTLSKYFLHHWRHQTGDLSRFMPIAWTGKLFLVWDSVISSVKWPRDDL